ncbi:MAG: hypothetical protein JOZ52_05940 [Acidobacteria bacterium]|nr:hypothetical protein [Acidobacteriota bacterium]
MRKLSLETVANVVVILVAVLVAGLLIRNNFFHTSSGADDNPVGRTIKLDGVNTGAAKYTVLLALSTKCHFCNESVPFYQQLAALRRAPDSKFQTVGVFREPTDAAREYLTDKGLELDTVVSRSLGDVGVRGTPTLLLVDGEGKVVQAWIGALNEAKQKEVLAKISGN